jgi:uncharacterized protein (DUF1800 family)
MKHALHKGICTAAFGLVAACSQSNTQESNMRTKVETSDRSRADAEIDELASGFNAVNAASPVQPRTEEQFRADLLAALRASVLSPVEKAQHVMDRLSYGQHPVIMPLSALVSYNRDGGIDAAATNALIVNYIVESMRPQIYPAPRLAPVVARFANASLDYAGISNRVRRLNKLIQDAQFTFSNRSDFVRAVQRGQISAPQQTLNDAIAERDLASENVTRYIAARVQLKRSLVELEQARFLSNAIAHKHSLNTKLLHMWFNRFNVSSDAAAFDLADYLQQINQRMYGSFADLLVMTAQHPAMNIYLHNNSNVVRYDRNGVEILPPNEDFARELIELHTLGKVSGARSSPNSYNLHDIEQTARVLSGWGVAGTGVNTTDTLPRRFQFYPSNHARGEKQVMGQRYAEGQAAGFELLGFLAGHQLTSLSVSRMLVRHFISDTVSVPRADDPEKFEPSPAVMELANAFRASGGNLRSVYQTMLTSPHFWSRESYRSKLKDPMHLVVSTLRGAGRMPHLSANEPENSSAGSLSRSTLLAAITQMKSMNQALFNCQLPTGYADTNATWTSASNVVTFVNFAYEYSTFVGNGTEAARRSYLEAESTARSQRMQPNQMAQQAIVSLLEVYALHDSPLLRFLPRESNADGSGLSLLQYGQNPDFYRNPETLSKTLWPVRSAAGGYFGSAEFMKR